VTDCDDTLFPGARRVFRLRRDTGGLDGRRFCRANNGVILGSSANQLKSSMLRPPTIGLAATLAGGIVARCN
jgi:hypothetical protein